MLYIQLDDEVLRSRIDRDMSVCVDRIRTALAEYGVMAVVLTGGLGRDEGSVIRLSDQTAYLASDYDFLVVVEQPVPNARCPELREDLSRAMGRPVEVGARTVEELASFPEGVATLELRLHRVLWGDKGVVSGALPEVSSSRLSPHEGSRLLFNRGSGLACMISAGVSRVDYPYFAAQLAKAIAAVGEANLIICGLYAPSQGEKMIRLQRVPWLTDQDRALIRSGLEVRMGLIDDWAPGAAFYAGDRGILRWLAAQHLAYECRRYDVGFGDWSAYTKRVLRIGIHRPQTYLSLLATNRQVTGWPRRFSLELFLSYMIPLERRLMGVLPHVLYREGPRSGSLSVAAALLNVREPIAELDLVALYAGIWEKHLG